MKRMFILAAALLAALAISAQEPNKFGLKKPDSPRSGKYGSFPIRSVTSSSFPTRWRICRPGNPITVPRER